ncbi:unnamed protein product [Microthlaspi erraticum]|uniref:Acidic protein n=1 Tax=Microthlaspi erraticum TaxID=1685480 RepID=A0A6D2JBK1_9BRAS|nr:unnamed protein product [Microthlaspi erraticum]
MKGKSVVLSVLIMSVVLAQIQVEASKKYCCATQADFGNLFNCLFGGDPEFPCVYRNHCIIIDTTTCPPEFPISRFSTNNLENSGKIVDEYCKLGCASSVCGAITTLPKSDASEIVNEAVAQCTNACSTFCSKGSKTAHETA